jgi:hypothetical protein
LGSLAISPSLASAQSPDEYFSFTFDVQLSTNQVTGSESFSTTVVAEATSVKNFPVSASEASITSSIVAVHQDSDARVTLNSGYTLIIDDFPNSAGETASVNTVVPLQFLSGSASGTYSITAELVEAKVKALGIWIPVDSFLPSTQSVGTVTYTASEVIRLAEPVEVKESPPEIPQQAARPWFLNWWYIGGAIIGVVLLVWLGVFLFRRAWY